MDGNSTLPTFPTYKDELDRARQESGNPRLSHMEIIFSVSGTREEVCNEILKHLHHRDVVNLRSSSRLLHNGSTLARFAAGPSEERNELWPECTCLKSGAMILQEWNFAVGEVCQNSHANNNDVKRCTDDTFTHEKHFFCDEHDAAAFERVNATSPGASSIMGCMNFSDAACLNCTLRVVDEFDMLPTEEANDLANKNFGFGHACMTELQQKMADGLCLDCYWQRTGDAMSQDLFSSQNCLVCGVFMSRSKRMEVEDDPRANRVAWCLLCSKPSKVWTEKEFDAQKVREALGRS